MAATIVWIGGLFFQAVILTPVLSSASSTRDDPRFLESVRRRFDPLAWLALAVLIVTGLTQMSANPSYSGLLVIKNLWSAALLSKHLAIGLMILVAGYQTWILYPQMNRSVLAQAAGTDMGADTGFFKRRQARTIQLNLVLGVIVLALTAVARTA